MLKWVLAFVLIFFIENFSFAQYNWAGGRDEQNYHFGYLFRGVQSRYLIAKKDGWSSPYYNNDLGKFVTDSLQGIYSSPKMGIGVGLVFNLRMGNNMDLRFTPTLLFCDRQLKYVYKDGASYIKSLEYPTFDFPLDIKIKTDRYKNQRFYVLMGLVLSSDISFKLRSKAFTLNPLDANVRNQAYFWGYELGIGFDIYLEYFKLSPELKIVNSMANVLIDDKTPFTNPIDKLFLNTVQFGLIFE